jgi:4-amino-4-deoxy-L-arabinose transferase-like glycosyltransferase
MQPIQTGIANEQANSWTESLLKSKWMLWVVSLLTIVFFSISNLPWQLNEYSQDRQALASFGIIKEGRWFYQQAPRDREATKPPLMPWISAGLFSVTRSWDFAWRFPSFVAAISLAILLFRTATKTFGASAGLLALSAFSLNMLSPRLATLVRTDLPLALVVFLIGLQIWRKIQKQEAWERRDRLMIFALLTVGLFMKGPIIYLFLLPGVAVYQWRWRKENMPSAWCGWWPWLASFGIFLVWVVAGIVSRPGFFDQVVMHEFLGRLGTAEQRPHPPYYYVAHLMRKFAPWSELLIILAVLSVRMNGASIRASSRTISPETFWLICWSLGGLIVMSLIPSKRIDRIYPVIPPLCLVLAAQTRWNFHNVQLRERFCRWSALALFLSILLTSHYVIYKKVFLGYRDHRDGLSTFGREVRREARAYGWRYEIIESHDGGMLLYLEKTHFIQPDRAIAEWNRGNLDAVIVRTQDAPDLMHNLPGAALSPIRTDAIRADRGRGYVVIVREASKQTSASGV